nr:oxidoreductase [Pseudomonas sp. BIGb0427]
MSDTIVAGERDGCASHGLYRVLGCVGSLKAGKVVADARPEVIDQAPSIVRVDAGGGFSQLAFQAGLPLLQSQGPTQRHRRPGDQPLCALFSALWVEIEQLAEAGLVALAFTPSHAWVAPAGGHRPVFGTNPIAFGWPRAGTHPYVFDFATSAIARGDIELHRRAGKAIPEGWGVDEHGQPSTDPNVVLDRGAMLTFGGHKGSALAAMVELIAGPLIGDLTSAESLAHADGSKSSPYHGELLIALDPRRFWVTPPISTWHGPRWYSRASRGRARGCRLRAAIQHGRAAWWEGWKSRRPCTTISGRCWSETRPYRAVRLLWPSTRRAMPSGLAFCNAGGSSASGQFW